MEERKRMKKLIFLAIALIGLIAGGCTGQQAGKPSKGSAVTTKSAPKTETMIPGKYVLSGGTTEESPLTEIFHFNDDNSLKIEALMTIPYDMPDGSGHTNHLRFNFALTFSGKWNVDRDSIKIDVNNKTPKYAFKGYSANRKDANTERISKSVQEYFKGDLSTMFQDMSGTYKIVKVDTGKMVLSTKGRQIIYNRKN